MGAKLSKLSLEMFEFANEIFVAAGAGLTGMGVLFFQDDSNTFSFLSGLILAIALYVLYRAFQCSDKITPNKHKIVFITGCDSGLGFSMAMHANELGYRVVAGVLNTDSEGAQTLAKQEDITLVQVNITNSGDVNNALEKLTSVIKDDEDNVLWAIINNAGIMTFAEFEWQTEKLIQNQINTNLFGTCLFTHAMCPILRQYKARLITVTSHCAYATLPGISIYGATKAALTAWSSALRIELQKYGVKVILFVPGSFTSQSQILANHVEQAYEMQQSFTNEQKEFYSDYFSRYNAYLNCLTIPEGVVKISDPNLYKIFESALSDSNPKFEYVNEPMRYWFYHKVFRFAPLFIRDLAITYFMGMPSHDPNNCPAEQISI